MTSRSGFAAFVLATALLCAPSARADEGSPPPPEIQGIYDLSAGLAVGGVVVTLGGGATAFTGMLLGIVSGAWEGDGTPWYVMGAVGVACLIGGIAMLVSARRTHVHADRRRDALAVSASIAPMPSGGLLALTLSF